MRLMTSAPQATCGFSMPRLATRAPLARSTRKPATLVVPRSTARPRVRRPGGDKSDQLSLRGYARAATSRFRATQRAAAAPRADRLRAAGIASARITRSRSDRLSASVACGTLMSRLDHGRIERQHFNGFAGIEFSAHHRRQRARGNLHDAIGLRRDLAGAHPARLFRLCPSLSCRRRRPRLRRFAPGRCRRCRGRRRRR